MSRGLMIDFYVWVWSELRVTIEANSTIAIVENTGKKTNQTFLAGSIAMSATGW